LPWAWPARLISKAARQSSRGYVPEIGTVNFPSAASCANSEGVKALAPRRGVLVEAVADAELLRGREVGDGEDTLGIAAGDRDEVGQGTANKLSDDAHARLLARRGKPTKRIMFRLRELRWHKWSVIRFD
jgi:hypothetical protein